MSRLKVWARIGLVALVLAAGTTWVAFSVTPSFASGSGVKSLDPTGDPTGGGTTSGDPDGPTGDISPSGGAVHSGSSFSSGTSYSPSVGSASVVAAKSPRRWFDWAQLKIALGYWLRRSVLGL